MRRWILALAAVAVAAPAAAQQQTASEGGVAFPEGWQIRLDRPNASLENVRFYAMGDGMHVTLGPSAIFYDPRNTVDGSFTASATFTQMSAARHPEAYGILIGGQDLDGPNQDYLYFLVRQDGQYLIKHRAGAETHTIHDWTANPVIQSIEGEGRATNALAIEAGPQRARFLINGTEVANFENVPYLNTSGIVGLRVNHNLDVHIEGFSIERGGG